MIRGDHEAEEFMTVARVRTHDEPITHLACDPEVGILDPFHPPLVGQSINPPDSLSLSWLCKWSLLSQ